MKIILATLTLGIAAVGGAAPAMALWSNTNSVNDVASKKSLQSASTVVLGDEIGLPQAGSDLQAMAKDPQFATVAADGVSYTEAVSYYKARLANKSSGWLRATTIGQAFRWAYGRESTDTEQAFWDGQLKAGSAWYATIADSLRSQLAKSPADHKKMISGAYFTSFGRTATDAEVSYWLPRAEVYGQIKEANRGWLYSPNGAGELVATVYRRRAWFKLAPTGSTKAILAKLSTTRLLFMDMSEADVT
jgi:hypothetical protein